MMTYVWLFIGFLVLAGLTYWAGRQIEKMPEEEQRETIMAMFESTQLDRLDF